MSKAIFYVVVKSLFKGALVILFIFVGLVIISIATEFDGTGTVRAKITKTKADLKALHAAVNMFKLDTGRYPSQEKGLIELVTQPADVTDWCPGGYLESTDVPRDAWKHDYIYKLTPEAEHPFVIISYGADGMPGGEPGTPDADLHSTDLVAK